MEIDESLLQVPHLASLCFPGKKTFNNLNEDFLDRRKRALNAYLQVRCLSDEIKGAHCSLDQCLAFAGAREGDPERARSRGHHHRFYFPEAVRQRLHIRPADIEEGYVRFMKDVL